MAQEVAYDNARETSWLVRMAQYIPPPSAEAFASLLPFFKRRRGANLPGTWLSSKSMATVTLSSAASNGLGPSIALILQGRVHEEHLLSNLAFTWPRFRDENEETASPGRVILASYKIFCTNEKHKFAMQFETVLQAEWFFETVKQLIDSHNGALEGSCNVDNSPINVRQHADNCGCYPLGTETALSGPGASSVISHEALRIKSTTLPKEVFPLSELSVNASSLSERNLPVVLPPRFPSFQLHQQQLQACNGSFQQGGENSAEFAVDLQNEKLLKEKLAICFLDPEFQDFVSRVERIWHSMEEELATQSS
ncbi:hypothetical protein GOP47_0003080 [Adiantum capillus-veneris]|uniref:Poor homologous synapsis 1 PH domain-containing protein n=1 Tax=Adiantum capillus-veneris TaxID=13818 RepID=A0A9D4VDA2_ADICA|nr:hypothetical protein GOP47_0003080 [Adiantum capillus-veneris]